MVTSGCEPGQALQDHPDLNRLKRFGISLQQLQNTTAILRQELPVWRIEAI
jgi:hypothetical protein